jgi:hypothetical protein
LLTACVLLGAGLMGLERSYEPASKAVPTKAQ